MEDETIRRRVRRHAPADTGDGLVERWPAALPISEINRSLL